MTIVSFFLLFFSLLSLSQLVYGSKIGNKNYCDPLIYKEACIDKTYHIDFNRVNKNGDIHKHLSIRIYAFNRETTLINTMLLFYSDMNTPHNAFMISSGQMKKYSSITKDSKLIYDNHIIVITKAIQLVLPYSIINRQDRVNIYDPDHSNYFEDAYKAYLPLSEETSNYGSLYINDPNWDAFTYYDALLSLDRYSSIWDHYNIFTITKHSISLSFNDDDGKLDENIEDFDGLTRIQCDYPTDDDIFYRKIHPKSCVVQNTQTNTTILKSFTNNNNNKGIGVNVNGRVYDNYKLVIDLSLRVNSIPLDLYLKWNNDRNTDLTIQLQPITQDVNASSSSLGNKLLPSSFILTSKMVFEMNDNDVIIIGVDILHYFPKIQYSISQNQFHVWYQQNLYYTDSYVWLEIISLFLLLILLACFFYWMMDINYNAFFIYLNFDVLRILKLKGRIYFSYHQIQYEVTVILVTVSLWILGSVFIIDHKQSQPPMFTYDNSTHRQIFGLFLLLSIFHTLILSFIISLTGQMNARLVKFIAGRCGRYFGTDYDATTINSSLSNVDLPDISTIITHTKVHPQPKKEIESSHLVSQSTTNTNVNTTTTTTTMTTTKTTMTTTNYKTQMLLGMDINTRTTRFNSNNNIINDNKSNLVTFNDNRKEEWLITPPPKKKKKTKRESSKSKTMTTTTVKMNKDEILEKYRAKRILEEEKEVIKQERKFIEKYHPRVIESPFPLVLVRNLAFITLVLSSLLCILIFDNNSSYKLYLVVIAYLLTYFMSYYIILLLIYLTTKSARVYNKSTYLLYILLLIAEIACFIVYVIWSMVSIHLNYFQHINSIYSDVSVYAFVIGLTTILILIAAFMVMVYIDARLKTKFYI